jgi:hypothetical protein
MAETSSKPDRQARSPTIRIKVQKYTSLGSMSPYHLRASDSTSPRSSVYDCVGKTVRRLVVLKNASAGHLDHGGVRMPNEPRSPLQKNTIALERRGNRPYSSWQVQES